MPQDDNILNSKIRGGNTGSPYVNNGGQQAPNMGNNPLNNGGIGGNIPQGYNSTLIQQALGFGDAAVAEKRAASMQNLGRIEGTMYDVLGRQQLQSEKDIAQRRMQAIRSGQTSAQIAIQEMQGIQARQIAAQAIAQQYDQQRLELGTEFAGAENTNRQFMLETLNQNVNNKAAVDAQVFASDWNGQMANVFGKDFWDGLEPDIKLGIVNKFQGIEISSALEKKINEILSPTKEETTPVVNKPENENSMAYVDPMYNSYLGK